MSLPSSIYLTKPLGKTPLQIIQDFRTHNPAYAEVKMAYAGRLDPMAEGLLLVLVGDECKKRDQYQKLDKEYVFTVLFGISTDSYDTLGKVTAVESKHLDHITKKRIEKISLQLTGQIQQPYPPYSAARVQGKPLYWWTRQNRLKDIQIPIKQGSIYSLAVESSTHISSQELRDLVFQRVGLVTGAFRQEEVLESWGRVLMSRNLFFPLYIFRVACSSGIYVRGLAVQLGEALGLPALALRIVRTRVGSSNLEVGN